ncbi:uncharacterized protein Z518_00481 [Rhinocladiella mackenziei CBS 650.93]|uniref:Cytochrome P450 monooxygenase n=1 Tax=Rhinocladiella mackenziei CBS 650.93 TaxID=1442369 RepID=A0A0D2G422_9EURO|nr:uncharacterized protein Z518_00481 [Rhinocladiella mackenziei CBS 650.93]KIX09402.1 hypothetical protein Z518_00481 [Rhinocladiella mackenziei CBS 650.93]
MHVLSAAGFGHAHDFDGGLREVPQGHTWSLVDVLMVLLQNLRYTLLFSKSMLLGMMMPTQYREINATMEEFRQYMKEIIAENLRVWRAATKPMYLSDGELLGNLYVFNLAGFETTANSLTFTISFLAANSDVQEWVGEEIDAVVKGKDNLDYEEGFPLLVRCLALMYETLRIWGPVSDNSRCTYVTTNLYGIHSDPRWWGADSLEWRQTRWVRVDEKTGKESIAPQPPGAAFMAWSAGPRVCPGRKFSQVEFVAVISSLLRRYRLKPLVMQSKSMKTEEQGRRALLEVIDDSMSGVTPTMRRPEDAGVVFVER